MKSYKLWKFAMLLDFMWDQSLEMEGVGSRSELRIYFALRSYLYNVFPCRQ